MMKIVTPALPIIVAEDHAIVREVITLTVHKVFAGALVTETSTVKATLEECERIKPALLILDLGLQNESTADYIPQIQKMTPETRIIVSSATVNRSEIVRCVRMGVEGFVSKTESSSQFAHAMREVMGGHHFFCAIAANALAEELNRNREPEARLTLREKEMLQAIAVGCSVKEAAGRIGICEKTAYTHRTALLQKTGCKDNVSLTYYALKRGFVNI